MLNQFKELAIFGLKKLDLRFSQKIDPEEFALAYSGGNDSHLLLWYIRYRNLPIHIMSVNTYREHKSVRKRMYNHADIVLKPFKSYDWVKAEYGGPCFTKQQDEYIKRYQRGSRSENTMKAINGGEGSKFQLNKKAKFLVLSGQMHLASCECCKYTKELPMIKHQKKMGLKAIIGIRSSESATRDAKNNSCMASNGDFKPLYDFPDQVVYAMYMYFMIDQLKVYEYISRTGCIGCPYGRNIEIELSLVTPQQKRYAIESFKESYDVKGVNYKDTQLSLF